ncbi:hypothetical protein C9I56_02995 [Paraburkholderia caribensis]|nr:hypothetical protein C9I56_02995 [Paraburkholderia caribensis]
MAYLYQRGLESGKWTTQADASRALNVSQTDLSVALRMGSLPAELLEMFADISQITTYTVRVIRGVIAQEGQEAVLERIRPHITAGLKLPAKAVLALVKGRMSDAMKAAVSAGTEEDRFPRRSQDLPMAVSDRYHRGIVNGDWTSYSGCSRALRISRRNISDAVSIGQLPPGVRSLFRESDLTFAVGRKLLSLEKAVGTSTLIRNAKNISDIVDKYAPGQILRELNGENLPPGLTFTRLRIKKGRGAGQLIIECNHPDFLLRYRRDMETALNQVVKRITQAERRQEEFALCRSFL